MRLSSVLLVAIAALLAPIGLEAQQWRTIEAARQLSDSQPHKVSVRYAAGKLDLSPSEDAALLYQMRIRYDEQATDAVHAYDARGHRLELGLSKSEVGWRTLRNMKGDKGGSMSLELSPAVPLDLDVGLGGAAARMELGGLKLKSLSLECGMAGSEVSFSDPNRIQMERMTIDLGMGGLKVQDLGNANVGEIAIHGAMGGVSLDFGDDLQRDVKISADFALGALEIAVPPGVGVMYQGEMKAGKFEPSIGFTRMDNAWYSMNWKDASRHITIVGNSTLADVKIQLSGR